MQLNKSKVGDRLDAYQDVFSPAVCLLDAKIHFNSTISNAHNGARYCTEDTKEFFSAQHLRYLSTCNIYCHYISQEVQAAYNYVPKALEKLKHPMPHLPQHATHAWTTPSYGPKTKYTTTDNSPLLDKNDTTQMQEISGTLLYYARAFDHIINEISNQQAKPAKNTAK